MDLLKELTKGGDRRNSQGKIQGKATQGYISGTVDMTRMGYGFIKSEDSEEDVFVSSRNLHTALHGDTVRVLLSLAERVQGLKVR